MLTLLQSIEDVSELLPIVRWLLNQRNDQGGFEGTQDTIVGIEALANFAVKIANKENNVNIDISAADTKCSFNVNKDNSLVFQSQKVQLLFYHLEHNIFNEYLLLLLVSLSQISNHSALLRLEADLLYSSLPTVIISTRRILYQHS